MALAIQCRCSSHGYVGWDGCGKKLKKRIERELVTFPASREAGYTRARREGTIICRLLHFPAKVAPLQNR
jgi:hypothetical protein